MQRVAFLPMSAVAWGEMAACAVLLKERGLARSLILLAGENLTPLAAQCSAMGLDCATLDDEPSRPEAKKGGGISSFRPLNSLRWRLRGPSAEMETLKRGHRARMERQRGLLAEVLDRFAPTVGVTAGDRTPWWELPFLGLCRQRGIGTLTIPVAYVGDRESLLPRRTTPFHDARNFPALAARLPRQVVHSPLTKGPVFFYQAPIMAALEELGLLPDYPWAHGCSLAERILAESQEDKDRWVSEGADPARIVVTGHRAHDDLYRALRAGRAQGRGQWGPQSPVVVSLPQLFEEGDMEWDDARREIGFLCQTLAEIAPQRTLVSLHPRMDPKRYRFVEQEYGLTIAKDRLSTFLSEAHIFLATFSSTLHWAVLCHVPTIVFDFFGFGYNNWDFLTGMVIVREKDRLGPELARLLGDDAHYQHMVAEQRRWAPRLSPFDGKCTQRILEMVCQAGKD